MLCTHLDVACIYAGNLREAVHRQCALDNYPLRFAESLQPYNRRHFVLCQSFTNLHDKAVTGSQKNLDAERVEFWSRALAPDTTSEWWGGMELGAEQDRIAKLNEEDFKEELKNK